MRKKSKAAPAPESDDTSLEFSDNAEALLDDIDTDGSLPDISEEPDSDGWMQPGMLSEEDEAEWIAAREKERLSADGGKRRKAVVPPDELKKGINLFEYLHTCTPPLDKKIIDIAIAQMQVPPELKDDAAQEIRITWALMKPDIKKFKPGQIASYAHRVARHTALRVRREIGSSVRLPGSAFRKKKDGTTYVTPGLLSVPLQWEELEGWLDADDAADSSFAVQGAGATELRTLMEGTDIGVVVEDEETETMNHRLALVNAKADKLSPMQRDILYLLIKGDSYESIQTKLKLKRAMLLNEIEDATAKLYRD